MELSIEMVLTFTGWYLLLVLPCSVCCVKKTFNYGSTTLDLNGYSCVINDVIREFYSESDAHCAYSCASDVTCGSFFYHHDDKTCVTCNNVYYDTSGLDTYPGMSYYIPEGISGLWNEWSAWTLCSATCDGGTRSRTRTCNGTVPPCVGDSLNIETCNAYACTPLASTCAEWASRGFNETRQMYIDPDGSGTTFSTVTVNCDLDTEPGKAFTIMHSGKAFVVIRESDFRTVSIDCNLETAPGKAFNIIHHDKGLRTYVDGYESCGSYEVILGYTIGFLAAIKIADISDNCRQFVQWECYKADLSWPRFATACTSWKNRYMQKSTYFTGPYTSGKYCYCGDQGNCLDPTQDCNCDKQDPVLTKDAGDITLKSDLPIYSFSVGDTGGTDEYGYHTIGPLMCW